MLYSMRCLRSFFLKAAALALGLTDMVKLTTLFQTTGVLYVGDPLFEFLSNRHVLLLASALEAGVILVLLSARRNAEKLLTVLWLCMVLWGYRWSLFWIVSAVTAGA